MIAKKYRMKREEIAYILKKGKTCKSVLFIVKYQKTDRKNPGFTVITSKKISNRAVTRNRLKRQIYEAIRNTLKTLETKESYDMILIPKKIIKEKNYREIKEDIENILRTREFKTQHGKNK